MTARTKIKPLTRARLKKRQEWRRRACRAAVDVATWTTGKPEREKAERELQKCLRKLVEWFGDRRAKVVARAVERRATQAWRAAS